MNEWLDVTAGQDYGRLCCVRFEICDQHREGYGGLCTLAYYIVLYLLNTGYNDIPPWIVLTAQSNQPGLARLLC
jgi:hypothetical protein